MVDAAFRGFDALPAQTAAGWWTVLGVERTATRDEIDTAYRRMAREIHPDTGGDAERFRLVTEAYQQARAVV